MSAKITSLLLLAFFIGSCAPRPQVASTQLPPTQAAPSSFPTSTPTAASFTATPGAAQTLSVSPTPTLPPVSVAAVNGNLYIRRGPAVAYNSIAVLYDGQSARAQGRDVLANWLEIPIPGNPETLGWVSIQTVYSAISGDLTKLPEIQPTDYPVPAFLRNCTYHNLTAEPGGILLPAITNFPANDVRINPGTYRVYDSDVEGNPEILKVELREGSALDVNVDGNGEKHKCE
jgi:hypothetical protein